MINEKQITLFFLMSFVMLACNKDCETIKDLPDAKVEVIRLEVPLFQLKSPADADNLLEKYPAFSKAYFQTRNNPDTAFSNFLFRFYQHKELSYLKNSSDSAFGDLSVTTNELKNFFGHVKYYYPSFHVPDVYTLVSGFEFGKDLLVSDSLVVIALDYFIGKKSKYRPPFYNYFLERYEKPYIVPMISLAVSNKFNETNPSDETMLANMIYYGKAYYFASKMLPCAHDSLIVQYSTQQIKDIQENADLIWGHFIEHKLLFETKPHTLEKYLGESPKVNEIGEKCPGRIGRWVGYQIVKKYMEENEVVSLQQLMGEKDALKIFKLAKYKPEKK